MSYESLYSLEHSVIFRETFNNSYSVARNGGIINATGVKFNNGLCTQTGNNSIQYRFCTNAAPFTNGGITIRVRGILKPTGTVTQLINGVGAARYIGLVSNTVGNNFSFSPAAASIDISSYYNKYVEIVIICNPIIHLFINASEYNLGGYAAIPSEVIKVPKIFRVGSGISCDLAEVYNRALSAAEIKLLYQQRLYTQPIKLPLLLDFDSTRGIIEDTTGLNTLTASNITIQQIGKVKSAYFNGTSTSNIILPSKNFMLNSFTVSLWVKGLKQPYNGGLVSLLRVGTYNNWSIYNTYGQVLSVLFHYSSGIDAPANFISTISDTNKWTNIIVLFNSGKLSPIYINGLNVGSISYFATDVTAAHNLYIGSDEMGRTFKGYISKVQIFSGIPSNPDQFAAQLYNSQKQNFL